jgi:TDG/mug DNA glycosylase family protein
MIAYKISNQAKILFVGINPHPGSYRRGVPFSNNKMFWYLLNRAGLLNEMESDLKNDESLKRIYEEKFIPKYGLNFVNLVNRPTVDVTELENGEEQMGVRRTIKLIRRRRPNVVCFIGKVTFNKFHGSRECDFGWQEKIESTRVYLMHFPIRGPASIRVEDLREVKRAADIDSPVSVSGCKVPDQQNKSIMVSEVGGAGLKGKARGKLLQPHNDVWANFAVQVCKYFFQFFIVGFGDEFLCHREDHVVFHPEVFAIKINDLLQHLSQGMICSR